MSAEVDAFLPRSRRFAGYQIVEPLDEHRGTLRYKALQLTIGRTVVLSILPASAARKSSSAAFFDRQLNVCATLRHDNVAGAIEAGEVDGHRYFVLEHVEGTTLHDALQTKQPFDVRQATRIALDVARGLSHLEGLKLVHRDVSPRTITLSDSGPARLVDFRRAKFLTPNGSETWHDASDHSAFYTSPECAAGERGIDVRADIYSTGCVLYQLLTGRPPFYGNNAAAVLDMQRSQRPRDPRRLRSGLPNDVVHVTDRCLQKERADRYPTATALATDLEACLAGRGPSAPKSSSWERSLLRRN